MNYIQQIAQPLFTTDFYLALILLITIAVAAFAITLITYNYSRPLIRLFVMDTLLGDTGGTFSNDTHSRIFSKFYKIDYGEGYGVKYMWIADTNKQLIDGKRITDYFFIYRDKDNTLDCV